MINFNEYLHIYTYRKYDIFRNKINMRNHIKARLFFFNIDTRMFVLKNKENSNKNRIPNHYDHP
jgi:hypothetical protein